MRRTFQSERRIVEQMVKNEMNITVTVPDFQVDQEAHDKGNTTNLNCGFSFYFGDALKKERPPTHCIMQEIFPAALGLELFLIVEKETFVPISLELLTAGGMPYRYFQRPCSHLSQFLSTQLQGKDPLVDPVLKKPFSKLGYARIFWMYNEITFLIFSKGLSQDDQWETLISESSDTHCVRVLSNSEQICFDGWVSHAAPNYDPRSKQVFLSKE